MPRKAKRVRVERGLYRAGDVWLACVTPKGQRRPRWLKLGNVGVQEARRLRAEFAYKLNAGQVPVRVRRLTIGRHLVCATGCARGGRRVAPANGRLI
jgi:hypothetical protein